ncbi:ester cyclase (plasmid) [Rhizobium sp. CB3060]|uniref:nuclear transport factor 2 family protein n=1 Tax=Rhizobium sp. CB3060 TaxID=3138255 RepID=UPI0021A36414|nr:ester cyclase [Rhizobium tropici]UWU26046.1 ester cyclase [Rhizobium tropici]
MTSNKEIVVHFYDQLFTHGNLEVINQYIGNEYINHNPNGGDGAESLRGFIKYFKSAHPNMTHTVHRVLAEDDLVLLHSHAILEPGTAGQAVIDIYRVLDGKIVEHWDVIQPVPETTVSGNDMFTTLSATTGSSPDPNGSATESKKVVMALIDELTVKRDLTAYDRYVLDPYYQHNPKRVNGVAAEREGFVSAFAAMPNLSIDVKRVIADGDMVAVHANFKPHPDDRGMAVIELFRVRDGKVVEHWDANQPVPETSRNTNTMF